MSSTTFDDLRIAAQNAASAVSSATVAIGRDGRGTGIVIGPGKVLTSAHNLRDRTTQLRFTNGRIVQATVAAIDSDGDLAVLDADTADASALLWAERVPEQGDIVFAASPTADGVRVSFGMVSAVARSFRGPQRRLISGSVEHSAPLARGASGGPLVDGDGRLVGINTHRVGRTFYLARPGDEVVRQRIVDLAAGKSPQPRRLGVALAPADVAAKLRQSVGLAERTGLLVRGVEANGPAAAAGIREGDLLVQVGEVELTSSDVLHTVLATLDGDRLSLAIVRGAEELQVEVVFGTAPAAAAADGSDQSSGA